MDFASPKLFNIYIHFIHVITKWAGNTHCLSPKKSPNSPPSHPLQPLVLLMEWPEASNFACLISGYYKLFVDPKRTIYFRTPGQSQLTKAGMLEDFLTCSDFENMFWISIYLKKTLLFMMKHLCCPLTNVYVSFFQHHIRNCMSGII